MKSHTNKILESIKQALTEHLPKGGKALLFGSQARGDARIDSDWDILIILDKEKLERSEFDAIQQKVLEILSVSGNTEYLHSIANLALLNTADNAALNNSTFDVKRNAIVDMDKRGQYIPFCTKMVFLKYYTPSEHNQLHFWGQADRIAYVNAINTVLAEYLPEAIILEKEEA